MGIPGQGLPVSHASIQLQQLHRFSLPFMKLTFGRCYLLGSQVRLGWGGLWSLSLSQTPCSLDCSLCQPSQRRRVLSHDGSAVELGWGKQMSPGGGT